MTFLVSEWVYDAPIKKVALKVLHIMPVSLLQEPSKTSKSKDYKKLLKSRFVIWKEGNINDIFEEGKTIQN